MQKYTYICWIHTDAMNNRRRKTSLTKYIPLTLLQGFERVVQGLRVRGSWRPNRNCNILTPKLWRSALCLSCSSDTQPEAQGPLCCDGFLYCILSASSLDPNSIGVPEGPLGWVWLSLPHLVFLRLELQLNWPQLPSWLRYIIVQSLRDHPLDLWNRMFNRHQAEITVMQFTGHSLPVHQSMSVPWEFFSLSNFIS